MDVRFCECRRHCHMCIEESAKVCDFVKNIESIGLAKCHEFMISFLFVCIDVFVYVVRTLMIFFSWHITTPVIALQELTISINKISHLKK